MQSKAQDVAAYLEEIPQDRQQALTRLRELCRTVLVGYEEIMDYGMPCYRKNGVVEVAFASQKNYISLHIPIASIVNAHRAELKGASVGKGCIKYTKPEKLDWDVIAELLADTVNSSEAAC